MGSCISFSYPGAPLVSSMEYCNNVPGGVGGVLHFVFGWGNLQGVKHVCYEVCVIELLAFIRCEWSTFGSFVHCLGSNWCWPEGRSIERPIHKAVLIYMVAVHHVVVLALTIRHNDKLEIMPFLDAARGS